MRVTPNSSTPHDIDKAETGLSSDTAGSVFLIQAALDRHDAAVLEPSGKIAKTFVEDVRKILARSNDEAGP